jgi:hypothetical protein
MAWTGVPVVTSLGKNIVRITGVSLAGLAVGTIGLAGGGSDIDLPASFPAVAVPGTLTMSDLVQVSYVNVDPGGGTESRHVHVEKANTPFVITFTNDGATATSPVEIYVQYLHSLIR